MPDYSVKLTEYGRAKIAQAETSGTPIVLTKIAVGDSQVAPTVANTTLGNEVHRTDILEAVVDGTDPGLMKFTAVITADVGGFWIREVGVFDNAGGLVYVAAFPDEYKPGLPASVAKECVIHLLCTVGNAANVNVSIDPSQVLATQSHVAETVNVFKADLASPEEGKGAHLTGFLRADISALTTVDKAINEVIATRNGVNTHIDGLLDYGPAVLILGDSISEGVGASGYMQGMAYMLARSIINASNHGLGDDTGYGYSTTINLANALNEPGLSTTGTLINGGVVGKRLRLDAGQTITVTGRAFVYADVFYDASVSAGHIDVAVNGSTIASKAVAGAGIQSTFPTTLNNDLRDISPTDTVTFTATGGTVIVTGIMTLRQSLWKPLVYVAAQAGSSYQDYTSAAALDELASYLNFSRGASPKLVLLCLGTNTIYNPVKALPPDEMLLEIQTVINGLAARCSTTYFALSIPPRANEATWPVIADGYTYADYVEAIVGFAKSVGMGVIRNDVSILNIRPDLFIDGVHPDNDGHRVMAKNACDTLGIAFNQHDRDLAVLGNFHPEYFPWTRIHKGGGTPDPSAHIQWGMPSGVDSFYCFGSGSVTGRFGVASSGNSVVHNSRNDVEIQAATNRPALFTSSGDTLLGGVAGSTPGQRLHINSAGDCYIRADSMGGVYQSLIGTHSTGATVIFNYGNFPVTTYTQAVERNRTDGNGNFRPSSDNTYSCGITGYRWSSFWGANGTIQTSDARQKTDVEDSILGLAFIKALRPVSYRFISGGNEMIVSDTEFELVDEIVTEEVEVEKPTVVVEEGRAVIKMVPTIEKRTVFDEYPLFDAQGLPVMEVVAPAVIGPDGQEIEEVVMAQSVHRVPRIEKIKRPKSVSVSKAGKRTHWGLLAQEVKTACDAAGVDFGGYVHDQESDEIGLRYDEFIGPLIKAVQEIAEQVRELR